MQDADSVWATLSSIPIGTLVAWIIVIGAIITALCTGAVKLYKLFVKTYRFKEEDNHLKQIMEDNTVAINNLMQSVERVEQKFDERIENVEQKLKEHDKTKLKELRHSITVDALRALSDGEIEPQMLSSLEDMFEDYDNRGGNWYVHDLMEKVRTLPIKTNNYEE